MKAQSKQKLKCESINQSLFCFLEIVLAPGWEVDGKKKNPRKTTTSLPKPVSLLINEKPDFAVKDLMQSDYEHIPP